MPDLFVVQCDNLSQFFVDKQNVIQQNAPTLRTALALIGKRLKREEESGQNFGNNNKNTAAH